jgi:hypothetical protein
MAILLTLGTKLAGITDVGLGVVGVGLVVTGAVVVGAVVAGGVVVGVVPAGGVPVSSQYGSQLPVMGFSFVPTGQVSLLPVTVIVPLSSIWVVPSTGTHIFRSSS